MTTKKLLFGLLAALLASPGLWAQDPFDGTWKIDLGKAQFSKKPDVYLLQNGIWHCESCIPPLNIKADGGDYKVASDDPCAETTSVSVIDDRTIKITGKRDGKITSTSKGTVSSDGNKLIFASSYTCNPKSGTVTSREEYARVSKGPVGSHAVSGSWRPIKASSSENELLQTWKVEGDKVSYNDLIGQSFTAKLDGAFTEIKGDPDHSLVSLRRENKNTLVETEKVQGKIVYILLLTVAPDRKTMTIVINDRQRGIRERVVAEKQ